MISFDVQSPFPIIPVDLIFGLMEEKWNEIEKFTYLTREIYWVCKVVFLASLNIITNLTTN